MTNLSRFFALFILLTLASAAHARKNEFFFALPMNIANSAEKGYEIESTAAGIGFGSSTLEEKKPYGVTVNTIVYFPLSTQAYDPARQPPVYAAGEPHVIGVDFTLGCSIYALERSKLSLPLSLSIHSRFNAYKTVSHLDLGLAGTVGFQFHQVKLPLFIRAQFYVDFSRIALTHTAKSVDVFNINSFGVIPEIGFSFGL
ncbi:MAG: hypothetical protein LBS64_05530 [Spirochaetaceae bacterium]|jgi:hypothetical protein|nr:hypothetical protein [Spirochaetaceae bacterium]